MEKAAQELGSLINIISNTFPDDNDLKGFAGISKTVIINSIKESETILLALKDYENTFEIIFLKRELADLFERQKKRLDDKFDKLKPVEFNSFLKDVSLLKLLVRNAYLSLVANTPIRTEAEIIKGKEELAALQVNLDELKKLNSEIILSKETAIQNITVLQTEVSNTKNVAVTSINTIQEEAKVAKDTAVAQINVVQGELTTLKDTTVQNITAISAGVTTLKDSATKIVADFEAKQKSSAENEQKINEFLAKIESHKTVIETISKNTTLWESEIKKAKEDIILNSSHYEALATKSKILQTEIDQAHGKIFGKKELDGKQTKGYLQETEDLKIQIATFLSEQETKFLAQFNQIESLLPGATTLGLAKAYQEQKDSYKKPIRNWSWVFIGTISIMTSLSIYLIYKQFEDKETLTLAQAIISFLKDLPFFIPTIWMAVFASKQQSQYKRLQQEYAFKEANAKSFHGHKKQIEELAKQGAVGDKELLSQLVAQLVIITSQNPSQTLDNKSHNDSPPMFKLIEKILPSKKDKEAAHAVKEN